MSTGTEDRPQAKVVVVYSWAGGVGRTQLTANVGLLLARSGLRVGLVDVAMTTPALHVSYRIDIGAQRPSLATLLLGECELDDLLYDVTGQMNSPLPAGAALFVVPGHISSTAELEQALAQDFDLGLLTDALHELKSCYGLDVILLDTQSGLNAPALITLLMADLWVLIGSANRNEEYGATLLDSLQTKSDQVLLVLSMPSDDSAEVDAASELYRKEVDMVLPHSTAMRRLCGDGLLVLTDGDDPLARVYADLADLVMRSLDVRSI